MADNEDPQPVNGAATTEGEDKGEEVAEQNTNENQSAEETEEAAEEGQADAEADTGAVDKEDDDDTQAEEIGQESQAQEDTEKEKDEEEDAETQEKAGDGDEENQQQEETRGTPQQQEEHNEEEEGVETQEITKDGGEDQQQEDVEDALQQEEEQNEDEEGAKSQEEGVDEEIEEREEVQVQNAEEVEEDKEDGETDEQQETEEQAEEREAEEEESAGVMIDDDGEGMAVGENAVYDEEENEEDEKDEEVDGKEKTEGEQENVGEDEEGGQEATEEETQQEEQRDDENTVAVEEEEMQQEEDVTREQDEESEKDEEQVAAVAEQQEEETGEAEITEAQAESAKEAEETTEGETGGETEASPGGEDQEGDNEDQGAEEQEEEATTEQDAEAAVEAAAEADEEQQQQQDEEAEQAQAVGREMTDDVEQSEGATQREQSDVNDNANLPGSSGQDGESVPPAPHLPTPQRSHTTIEGQMSTSALNVVWSFGLNRNVPVLNLSDGVRQAIMYPCAHVGVMYDFKNNKQHILQAHLNPITCSAVSQDKRWLVTGDVGPDAMVNIWDTYTGTPIQTMFDPNPQGGVVAVALTPDSRYLATLSALPIQTFAIWDWTVDGDVPICSADLKPEFGIQNYIYFDPTDIHHLVTNSESQVLFYHWVDNVIKYYAPPLSDTDFNKTVGRYSQSLFQVGIARALTATSIGNLVVWDNNRPLSKIMDVNQSADKKALKIIKVHDKGINVLTTTDVYIVIGDTGGHVKFFDQGLRLIYWYQDFHSGPCTAISFAHIPDFSPVAQEGTKYPNDVTKQAKPFVVRDFIVGTAIAVYCSISTDGSKMKIIHREHDAAVHALDAHPRRPIIAMGSYSGLLKLWDYRAKEVVASRVFEKCHIQCLAFDPKGFFLAVGLTSGTVYLVDSVALLNQLNDPYKYARDAITHIAFSHNSQYFATADAGFTITVYKRQRKEGRNPYVWHGRYRSHYKPVRDLLFDIHLDTNEPKLLSLGEDRMLIEYDLNFVGKTNNHVVPLAQDRIEQGAIPQCMTKYPQITQEHFFLTANDQYKLKCYNSTTKMCRKTVLGPTYGSPIRKMMVVPHTEEDEKSRFMAYITDEKVGLHFLPATGNPHLAMALIAHPSGISNLACSFDGAYLFTAGGPDFAVHMWEINIAALEAQCKLGGEDLVPFYGLLEGGRDGELFAELEDYFYYAQLRHQGINSMDQRKIGNRVPLSEVPFIMRAMGFYPSEQEIEDMINEVKYDEYISLGHYQEDIDLGRFIKLYVNHRPAFGLSPEKLLWAFETLAGNPELGNGGNMERGDFLDLLQKKGEHMTEYELAEHLTTLLGFNQEGGSCEQEPFEADKAGAYIADALPYDINAEILVNEILGFSMTVDPPAPEDTKHVIKSAAS